MMDLISLILVFVFGIAVGILVSSFFFESRLRFYKEFIEHRLASINLLRFHNSATHKPSEPSPKKTILGRPSERDERSKSPKN